MPDLPSSLALTSISDGASLVASPVRNNFTAIQTAVNALIAALSGGSANQVLVATDTDTVGFGGAFADWTPTITQSGNVTFTDTYSNYIRYGKLIIANFQLAVTGTGTAGNAIVIGGLPVAAVSTNAITGYMLILDNGTSWYHGGIEGTSTTAFQAHQDGQGNALGITTSFALASGDIIKGQAVYEAA